MTDEPHDYEDLAQDLIHLRDSLLDLGQALATSIARACEVLTLTTDARSDLDLPALPPVSLPPVPKSATMRPPRTTAHVDLRADPAAWPRTPRRDPK